MRLDTALFERTLDQERLQMPVDLMLDVPLFNPNLHPRDWLGRFRNKPQTTPEAKSMQSLLDRSDVAVRTGPTELKGVLQEGRFKTTREGMQSRGFQEPRAKAERTIFGTPEDANPKDAPVYGYVTDRDEWGFNGPDDVAMGPYGSVKVTLGNPVKSRTTVTFGDSLVQPDPQPSLYNQVGDKTAEGYDHREYALDPIGSYIEAQIHGTPKAGEIKHVAFGHGPPDEELADLLAKWHIPWAVDRNAEINKAEAIYDDNEGYML